MSGRTRCRHSGTDDRLGFRSRGDRCEQPDDFHGSPATSLIADGAIPAHNGRRQFAEAFMLQITNPQPLVFFISLLPQFIDQKLAYIPQVVIMTIVYSFLVFAVMTIYTFAVARARTFFKSPQASLILRRTSAVFFFIIAALVIVTMIRGV